MSNPSMMLRRAIRRFIKRREGNIAMLFGLCMIPVVIAAGMAVDVTRAYMVKSRLAAALDAAALAVGSEASNAQNTTLQTDLQKYFFANYPATALGQNVTVAPIPPTGQTSSQVALGQDVISYQAQATVPMTFMQIFGFSNITVTAVATTQRNAGMEIALVLDNTGSMLCGPNDGAPNYSNGQCQGGVDSGDTTCSDSATTNQSRICTLRNAANDFVNILTGAQPAQGMLYIGVVPYVTTVNVAQALCGSVPTLNYNCTTAISNGNTNVTDIACGPNFMDQYGYLVDQPFAVYASVQAGSNKVKINSGTPPYNPPNSPNSMATHITNITNVLAAGMVVQQIFTQSSGANNTWDAVPNNSSVIPNNLSGGTTIAGITDATDFTLSANATSSGIVLLQFGFNGTLTSGSATITGVPGTITTALTSNAALPGSPPLVNAWSVAIANSSPPNGIPVGNNARNNPERATSIQAVTAGGSTVTLCQPANASVISSAANNNPIMLYNPVPYDASSVPFYKTGAGNGPGPLPGQASVNASTPYWMGCVIEATSQDENAVAPPSGSTPGVLASTAADPDVNDPPTSLTVYPFWWVPGDTFNGSGLNNWVQQGIVAQTNAPPTANPPGEIQGNVTTDWDSFAGPNQGCPVPMLPLTDVTLADGKQAVLNAINSMWPRDAGGTQVAVGMTWGWRVLSPTGPFTPVAGHPLGYATATNEAWKKVVVLMTDGTEEWPSQDQLTGMGFLQDGKLGTTSFGTISSQPGPLDTRLQQVCTNMAASGHFIIYTVGLGSDGASNVNLQNCATGPTNFAGVNNGGFFIAANPATIDQAFQKIANAILDLRLTQ